jgi:hypothetical protein
MTTWVASCSRLRTGAGRRSETRVVRLARRHQQRRVDGDRAITTVVALRAPMRRRFDDSMPFGSRAAGGSSFTLNPAVRPDRSGRMLMGDSTSAAAPPWRGAGAAKRACGRWSNRPWKQASGRWSETRLSPKGGFGRRGGETRICVGNPVVRGSGPAGAPARACSPGATA